MGQNGRDRRAAGPLSVMADGMRQMGRLGIDDVRQAMAHLSDPDSVSFLDMMGRTREERVERMAAMLRNSAEADIEEMGVVFSLAMARAGAQPADPAGRRRRPDPVGRWTDGVRRIATFDPGDMWRGFENFARPSAGGMLSGLGRTRREQVEKMAGLLSDMSPSDMDEMATVYALALARASEGPAPESPEHRRTAERPRRRRGQTSAEWRQERRRA